MDEARAGDVGHHQEDRPEDRRGTEVRLDQHQQARNRRDPERLQEDPVLVDGLLGEEPGEDDDHERLGELRGLNPDRAHVQPARGAVGRGAHQRHREQHDDGEAVDRSQEPAPEAVVDDRQRYRPHETDDESYGLVGGVGLPRVGAGHVDGQDAEPGERQGDKQQRHVHGPPQTGALLPGLPGLPAEKVLAGEAHVDSHTRLLALTVFNSHPPTR